MKSNTILLALIGAGLATALSQNLLAAPKEKPTPEVEAKLTTVIKDRYPDASITSMAKESEDGLNFVGIQFTSNGRQIDADVMEDGTLVETEETADVNSFPKPAADALKAATKGLKVDTFEIATTYAVAAKDDPTATKAVKLDEPKVAYEADVEKIQKGEFSLSADGSILESPAWATKTKVHAKAKSNSENDSESKGKDEDKD